jgi:hypothetical protein
VDVVLGRPVITISGSFVVEELTALLVLLAAIDEKDTRLLLASSVAELADIAVGDTFCPVRTRTPPPSSVDCEYTAVRRKERNSSPGLRSSIVAVQ